MDVPAPQKHAPIVTDVQRKKIEKEYKCLECGKMFSNYHTFYHHKKMHEGIIYRCVQCQSTFQTISGLKYHSKTVHEVRKFECHHCQNTFKAKHSLKRHLSLHFNSIVYPCNQCSAQFVTHAALRHHSLICSKTNVNNLNCIDVPAPQKHAPIVTDVKYVEKKYKCLECGKIFTNYFNFYHHKKMHEGIIYRCAQCPSTYQTSSGLHNHLKTVHELLSFECHHCQTTFKAKRTLKRHMSMHFNFELYPCNQCPARFFKHATLRHHSLICPNAVTDVKNVEKEYKCLECGKIFSKYHNLNQHKRVHEGRIYRCLQCPSTYKSQNGLKKHTRTHEGIIYRCTQCPSTYKSQNGLKYHVRTEHEVEVVTDAKNVEKKYKCLECGNMFSNYHKFYEHKKMHKGIIYRCVQCPSTYQTSSGLLQHSKTVHELRKFECHHCQTTYKKKYTLKVHMSLLHRPGIHGSFSSFDSFL
jgi:KRAB domain-containing zinc finger protein